MKEEVIKEKKKQKAPLGIRPDDYIEEKFKKMADDMGLSQTKLFEKFFIEYTRNSSEALRLQALDCSLELQSVNTAASTFINALEKIVTKAQAQIIATNRECESVKNASEKKIELANIDLTNKIRELELKNKQLEEQLNNANSIAVGFNAVKDELNSKIENLTNEVVKLNESIKEKDRIIKDKNIKLENIDKAKANIEKEMQLLKEEKTTLESKNKSLQTNTEVLQGTINSFNSIKKAEIEAIKDNEATINQLKIDRLKAEHENEIQRLKNEISSKELEIKNLTKEKKPKRKTTKAKDE
ncbi:hypothetical protein [Gemella morbillorum]